VFKESIFNQNLKFLLAVIGVAVISWNLMHICDVLMFFVSYLDSTMLGIGNVVCEDQKTMCLKA
jgi:hypothetical protein